MQRDMNIERMFLTVVKELSDGLIKVAIGSVNISLEDNVQCLIKDLKVLSEEHGYEGLVLVASSTEEENQQWLQVAVYSENAELFNQICCTLEESPNSCLELEAAECLLDGFQVYKQRNFCNSTEEILALLKDFVESRQAFIISNSRTSSTEAVAGSAPLSQGSSGFTDMYGSDAEPQLMNFTEHSQDLSEAVPDLTEMNVELVSPDSGLVTVRSSRSSKESSVFLSDESPVAESSGFHHNSILSLLSVNAVSENESKNGHNNILNFDPLYAGNLSPLPEVTDLSSESDFLIFEESKPLQVGDIIAQERDSSLEAGCLVELYDESVSNLVNDDKFTTTDTCDTPGPHYPENCPADRFDSKVPPTPVNSLVENSPLADGLPRFFPEDIIEKINEMDRYSYTSADVKQLDSWNDFEEHISLVTSENSSIWQQSKEQSFLNHTTDIADCMNEFDRINPGAEKLYEQTNILQAEDVDHKSFRITIPHLMQQCSDLSMPEAYTHEDISDKTPTMEMPSILGALEQAYGKKEENKEMQNPLEKYDVYPEESSFYPLLNSNTPQDHWEKPVDYNPKNNVCEMFDLDLSSHEIYSSFCSDVEKTSKYEPDITKDEFDEAEIPTECIGLVIQDKEQSVASAFEQGNLICDERIGESQLIHELMYCHMQRNALESEGPASCNAIPITTLLQTGGCEQNKGNDSGIQDNKQDVCEEDISKLLNAPHLSGQDIWNNRVSFDKEMSDNQKKFLSFESNTLSATGEGKTVPSSFGLSNHEYKESGTFSAFKHHDVSPPNKEKYIMQEKPLTWNPTNTNVWNSVCSSDLWNIDKQGKDFCLELKGLPSLEDSLSSIEEDAPQSKDSSPFTEQSCEQDRWSNFCQKNVESTIVSPLHDSLGMWNTTIQDDTQSSASSVETGESSECSDKWNPFVKRSSLASPLQMVQEDMGMWNTTIKDDTPSSTTSPDEKSTSENPDLWTTFNLDSFHNDLENLRDCPAEASLAAGKSPSFYNVQPQESVSVEFSKAHNDTLGSQDKNWSDVAQETYQRTLNDPEGGLKLLDTTNDLTSDICINQSLVKHRKQLQMQTESKDTEQVLHVRETDVFKEFESTSIHNSCTNYETSFKNIEANNIAQNQISGHTELNISFEVKLEFSCDQSSMHRLEFTKEATDLSLLESTPLDECITMDASEENTAAETGEVSCAREPDLINSQVHLMSLDPDICTNSALTSTFTKHDHKNPDIINECSSDKNSETSQSPDLCPESFTEYQTSDILDGEPKRVYDDEETELDAKCDVCVESKTRVLWTERAIESDRIRGIEENVKAMCLTTNNTLTRQYNDDQVFQTAEVEQTDSMKGHKSRDMDMVSLSDDDDAKSEIEICGSSWFRQKPPSTVELTVETNHTQVLPILSNFEAPPNNELSALDQSGLETTEDEITIIQESPFMKKKESNLFWFEEAFGKEDNSQELHSSTTNGLSKYPFSNQIVANTCKNKDALPGINDSMLSSQYNIQDSFTEIPSEGAVAQSPLAEYNQKDQAFGKATASESICWSQHTSRHPSEGKVTYFSMSPEIRNVDVWEDLSYEESLRTVHSKITRDEKKCSNAEAGNSQEDNSSLTFDLGESGDSSYFPVAFERSDQLMMADATSNASSFSFAEVGHGSLDTDSLDENKTSLEFFEVEGNEEVNLTPEEESCGLEMDYIIVYNKEKMSCSEFGSVFKPEMNKENDSQLTNPVFNEHLQGTSRKTLIEVNSESPNTLENSDHSSQGDCITSSHEVFECLVQSNSNKAKVLGEKQICFLGNKNETIDSSPEENSSITNTAGSESGDSVKEVCYADSTMPSQHNTGFVLHDSSIVVSQSFIATEKGISNSIHLSTKFHEDHNNSQEYGSTLEDFPQTKLINSGKEASCLPKSTKHEHLKDKVFSRSVPENVGMDISYEEDLQSPDGTDNRLDPPDSLDVNGTHPQRKKLAAPEINLSLDQSEGSILSDDNLDTPDDLDINVDDLDTPDEADSLEYTGHGNELGWEDVEATNVVETREDAEPIPEYTAEEERQDARLWRTVVIGEQEHRIDMKAIEPYQKVISHGGYYGDGLNAIIVFAACFLPESSRTDYHYIMENLFLYVISTLELMVAEDYMIVYLNGATPRRRMPGLGWMKKCYQMIDRRLRKNLKSFIIVHPSWFIRTILAITRPFISSKFSSKIKYVNSLAELAGLIPMEYVHIPDSIIKFEEERGIKRYECLRVDKNPMESKA
ncbi:uncharacterized protein LOC114652147 isoform X2 [Erpetoichthys calabaricus]|uniref:uncharacterized protein LOC114652147 isoform X2 n=1 Tax=Erpetoichthys calabaricus TaxID=27687 RepID=UPI0022347D9C|nr:uncharacterized protein LOC114652147 isoform X2 [Erpetoichthys calabaricus]